MLKPPETVPWKVVRPEGVKVAVDGTLALQKPVNNESTHMQKDCSHGQCILPAHVFNDEPEDFGGDSLQACMVRLGAGAVPPSILEVGWKASSAQEWRGWSW